MNAMKSKFDIDGIAEKAFAGRWVAGARIKDAVDRAADLKSLRETAVISYLGGRSSEKWAVADVVSTYQRLIKAIGRSELDSEISLGITQLGLDTSRVLARRSYESIANRARKQGVFVWLGAESHETADATVAIYRRQMGKGGVGISLRACLRRTEQDMRSLVGDGAVIRLVKGSPGNRRVAFTTKSEIDSSYTRLMGYLFRSAKAFTIATHDPGIMDEAMLLGRSYRKRVTYEIPIGVKSKYAEELASLGYRVAIGVPFGRRWTGYAYGRLSDELGTVPLLRRLLSSA